MERDRSFQTTRHCLERESKFLIKKWENISKKNKNDLDEPY